MSYIDQVFIKIKHAHKRKWGIEDKLPPFRNKKIWCIAVLLGQKWPKNPFPGSKGPDHFHLWPVCVLLSAIDCCFLDEMNQVAWTTYFHKEILLDLFQVLSQEPFLHHTTSFYNNSISKPLCIYLRRQWMRMQKLLWLKTCRKSKQVFMITRQLGTTEKLKHNLKRKTEISFFS